MGRILHVALLSLIGRPAILKSEDYLSSHWILDLLAQIPHREIIVNMDTVGFLASGFIDARFRSFCLCSTYRIFLLNLGMFAPLLALPIRK